MSNLLLKLYLIAAAIQLGLSLTDMANCHSRECASRLDKASREVLRIDWRPISVWPEKAKKFR